jgi:hypothetical protein
MGRAEDDQVRLAALGQRLQRFGGRSLLDVDDLELAAVPGDDTLGQQARVLAALVVLVAGDDLRVQGLLRQRVGQPRSAMVLGYSARRTRR